MSWSGHGRGGRRGYHHGNLREALVNAALDLIASKGPAGFTFAEAARQAGVSAAAPYRHFRDRDALMADVAKRGFERFEARLAAAWDEGRPTPLAGLERMGHAYLGFAREEPAYFSAMFEAGVPLNEHRELQEAGDRAFAVLRKACEWSGRCQEESARPP
jgi:AcrR family transcriptional regulator